jgi:hypothetical protein
MAQPPTTNPHLPAVDRPTSEPADAITERQSYWFYRHRYGDPSAMFVPVDASQTADHGHNIPARLTCDVVYVRSVWAVFRRVRKTWVAPAGSYCLILGHWTDGTLRLQLGLPDTQQPDRRLSIDGRFPGWIAEPTTERLSLPANFARRPRRSALHPLMAVLLLAILASAYLTHGFGLQTLTGATGGSPAATPTAAAAQPTATAQPTPLAGSVIVANTDHQGVYVRRTPAMADRVRAYPDGTKLRVIGPDAQGEGMTWRHVAAPDGLEGYVPAQYVVNQS